MKIERYGNNVTCRFTEQEVAQGKAETVVHWMRRNRGYNLTFHAKTRELFHQGDRETNRDIFQYLEKIQRRLDA